MKTDKEKLEAVAKIVKLLQDDRDKFMLKQHVTIYDMVDLYIRAFKYMEAVEEAVELYNGAYEQNPGTFRNRNTLEN
jgi:phage-related protein